MSEPVVLRFFLLSSTLWSMKVYVCGSVLGFALFILLQNLLRSLTKLQSRLRTVRRERSVVGQGPVGKAIRRGRSS